jgi:hypothetical protein
MACATCGTSEYESKTHLLDTTTDKPPPLSWTTHLRTTINSIIMEDCPDKDLLRNQYRVPPLSGMHPGWLELLLCPQGLYQVTSQEDMAVSDMFVYPRGSFMDMHVGMDITLASRARACVCDDCDKRLRMSTRSPKGRLPQFAIANDLVIGVHRVFRTPMHLCTTYHAHIYPDSSYICMYATALHMICDRYRTVPTLTYRFRPNHYQVNHQKSGVPSHKPSGSSSHRLSTRSTSNEPAVTVQRLFRKARRPPRRPTLTTPPPTHRHRPNKPTAFS